MLRKFGKGRGGIAWKKGHRVIIPHFWNRYITNGTRGTFDTRLQGGKTIKSIIYETKGRAREFSELAINLFDFCFHGCVYCYSPDVIHKNKQSFMTGLYPRITVQDVIKSGNEWAANGETRKVLLSFLCDPYQPIEQDTQITRKTIIALHEAGLNVIILTKAGSASTRDFDLLTPKDAYATTLTCFSTQDSLLWEPNAAPPQERIKALELASLKGIETWVSLEPILEPKQAEALIGLTADITGHYKIGKLNYINKLPLEFRVKVECIDWYKSGWNLKELCDRLKVPYYIKKDLLKEMGVKPEEFQQTCPCQ